MNPVLSALGTLHSNMIHLLLIRFTDFSRAGFFNGFV